MEILTYLYIIVDLSLLIGGISGLVLTEWLLGICLLLGLFVYPWILEPILWVFFKIIYCCYKRPYYDDFKNISSRGANLVYHPKYNIKLCGIEKKHPFDSCKYERVLQFLKDDHNIHLNSSKPNKIKNNESNKQFLYDL